MTKTAGEPAPDFALTDDHGTVHRLSGRRGHWTLVFFYPEDDTPGCTIQACAFRDEHEALTGIDAEVWGVSPDDAASHARFREKFGLPFVLLCDEDHAVAEAYGAWGKKVSYGKESIGLIRSSFLVGPDLTIAHVWPRVRVEGHAVDVRATIERLAGAGSGA